MTPQPCLTCHNAFARRRGCCPACYDRHCKAVRDGKARWAQLEARGLALAVQPAGQAWMRGFRLKGAQ